MSETFAEHKSHILKNTFKEKPFQGQSPSQAKVIFFGRDANYPIYIEDQKDKFDLLLQYHRDGVGFWENKYRNNSEEKHHPFLICMERGDPGYKYHKVFSEMGLVSTYAKHISFVELLDVPTMGDPRNDPQRVFDCLLKKSESHLEKLFNAMVRDKEVVVFVPNSAIVKMNKISVFPQFYKEIYNKRKPIENECPLKIHCHENIHVYKCYHFSDSRGRSQLKRMKEIIDEYINK